MAAPLVRKLAGTLAASYIRPSLQYMSTTPQLQKCLNRVSGSMSLPTQRGFTHWSNQTQPKISSQKSSSLLQICLPFVNSVRTAVRCSLRRGTQKSVKSVPARFFRLPWGIYIRARAGRHKKKWKKPEWMNERGKYHVFTNKVQSKLLDKMTTGYWKKTRHYVNNPYEPYMKRTRMEYTPPKYLP